MSMTHVEALRQVRLEPGTVRAELDDFEVVVRVSRKPLPPDPPLVDPSASAMLEPWVEFP